MASRVAAEVAADAILIGRYFGRPAASSAISRAVAAVGATAATSRGNSPSTEGDGPGVRMMASSSASGMVGGGMMAAPGPTGAGSVRFMSIFGRKHAERAPTVAEQVASKGF